MIDLETQDLIGAYAYGTPSSKGSYKTNNTDFVVTEDLGFRPEGEGEHLYCYIQKTGLNTEEVASKLAKVAEIPIKQVSYAGLKDKNAITYQWFSIHLPGKYTPDLLALDCEGFKVLEQARHVKKLQRGSLQGNFFNIKITEFTDHENDLIDKIEQIKQGFPNYFGEQRFGFKGNNLQKAYRFLIEGKKIKSKHLKSLLYSTVRSWLFNIQLNRRIIDKTWNKVRFGDAVSLTGTNSFFICEEVNDEIIQRTMNHDISPAGYLWGRNSSEKLAETFDMMGQALNDYQPWLKALEEHGLTFQTRPYICWPKDLQYKQIEDTLNLEFYLPKGSYATSLLREIVL